MLRMVKAKPYAVKSTDPFVKSERPLVILSGILATLTNMANEGSGCRGILIIRQEHRF